MNRIIPQATRYGLTCFLTVGLMAFVQSVNAAVIIDWGGDYVSSDTSLNGTPTSAGGTTTYAYSTTEVKSPAGPNFYGAFSLTNESGSGTPQFSSVGYSLSATDTIRLGATPDIGSTSLTARGLLFFQKPDFLGGGASNAVTLDASSSLKFNVTSSGAGGTGRIRQTKAAVYASVGGVWDWYVSLATKAGTTLYEYNDLGGESWALYSIDGATSPLNNASTNSLDYTTLGSAFEDVSKVGYFYNYKTIEGNNFSFYVDSIDFNASVVPEPTVGALLGVGAFLTLLLRRPKSRRQAQQS